MADHERELNDAIAVTEEVKVEIRSELWLTWGRIAAQHCQAAAVARRRYGATDDSADDSHALGEESSEALQSICSAAFSVEAVERLLEDLVISPATRQAWARNKLGALKRLRRTLKEALDLPGADVDSLVDAFMPTVIRRGKAVHYYEGFQAPAAHPVAGLTGPAEAEYTLENGREAVAAMRHIYSALRNHPKAGAHAWAEQSRDALGELASFRCS